MLRNRGWTKQTFEDHCGRVCMSGALNVVHRGRTGRFIGVLDGVSNVSDSASLASDRAALETAIRELFPGRSPYYNIARFNDHPDTTEEDVDRVFARVFESRDEGA